MISPEKKNVWCVLKYNKFMFVSIRPVDSHFTYEFNSSPPSATCMCHWTGSPLAQVLASSPTWCHAITWSNTGLFDIFLLAALKVVILTTFSAAINDNFIKMMTFTFQCHPPYPEPVVFQWQSSGNPVCLELRPQCTLECHWRKFFGNQCASSGLPVAFQWSSSVFQLCKLTLDRHWNTTGC